MISSDNSTHGIKRDVMLRRLSTMALRPSDRAEEDTLLLEHVAQSKTGLLSWIKERNLSGQIIRVEEFSAFGILFIKELRTLAQSFAQDPSVLSGAWLVTLA